MDKDEYIKQLEEENLKLVQDINKKDIIIDGLTQKLQRDAEAEEMHPRVKYRNKGRIDKAVMESQAISEQTKAEVMGIGYMSIAGWEDGEDMHPKAEILQQVQQERQKTFEQRKKMLMNNKRRQEAVKQIADDMNNPFEY